VRTYRKGEKKKLPRLLSLRIHSGPRKGHAHELGNVDEIGSPDFKEKVSAAGDRGLN